MAAQVAPARGAAGNVTLVLAAARDIDHPLALGDALALTLVLARCAPDRYDRAAVRWLGHFAVEARGVSLTSLHVAIAPMAGPARGQR